MRLAGFLLAAVCALTLFTGLDRVGFLDWREARDVQVAREMIEGREALTPLLGHEALFEKPAPAYAPEALMQLLGGGSPATSRRARAVLAVLLLLITGSIGAQMFGLRAGVLTAIVLGTSLILPLAARVDGTQLLASLLGWVGVAGLGDVEFGRRAGRSLRLVVTWGALAAALMVGGPLPALWPLAGWALYVALARKDGAWRRAALGPGLTILIGVGLPWYGAMSERHGAAFLSHAPFFPYAVETRGAWWTGPILTVSFLVVSFFPWSALLPGAISHAATWWRRVLREAVLRGGEAQRSRDPIEREVREEGAAHFFIACLLAALAPIALYPGPPLTAALPAIPAAALLCGRLLDHLFEDPRRLHVPVRNAVWLLVLVGTVGAVLVAMVAPRIGDAAPDLRLLAAMVFVAAWIPFLANLLGRRRIAVMAMALPVTIGAPIVQWRVLPAMEEWLNTRAVCDAMSRAAPEFASLVTAEPPRPSLRLYTTHNLVEAGALRETVAEQRARDGLTYLVFRPVRESWVASHAGGVLEIVLRTPTLVLARVHPVPG